MVKTVIKLSILPIVGMTISAAGVLAAYQDIIQKSIVVLSAPGEKVFQITKPDVYVVWQSNTAIVDNAFVSHSWNMPVDMHVAIINSNNGTTQPLTAYQGASTQSGSSYRESLFKADLQPGNYKLMAECDPQDAVTLELTKYTGFRSIVIFFGIVSLGTILIALGFLILAAKLIRYFFGQWTHSTTKTS